jgi:hypothetical protein
MFPYIHQGNTITVIIDKKTHIIHRLTSVQDFDKVELLIREGRWNDLKRMLDVKTLIKDASPDMKLVGETVHYKGYPLNSSLSKRLIQLIKNSMPIDYIVKFIENLNGNPSMSSVKQMYTFLERNNLPITSNGTFVAYKAVDNDYMSFHACNVTGNHVRYMVGDEPSMPRNQVSDDPTTHCSAGLHACSKEYLNGMYDTCRLMLVEINPADVVSVPNDCSFSKLRVCKMKVLSELEKRVDGTVVDDIPEKPIDLGSDTTNPSS